MEPPPRDLRPGEVRALSPLQNVRDFLGRGDRGRARAALRSAVFEACVARFTAGWTRHPLLAPASRDLLAAAGDLAGNLLDDPVAAHDVVEGLGSGERGALNMAFERLLPDFALLLEEALADARHELGSRASNVDDEPAGPSLYSLLPREAQWTSAMVDEALGAGAAGRLEALEKVRLADLDAVDASAPALRDLADDRLVFACPGCGALLAEPVESAGRAVACRCGRGLTVPRAPLERMAAWLKQKRDVARGIGRCKVCKAVIQLGKQGSMRAGYCGAYCARRGRELFREYVAHEGWLDGDQMLYACDCGTEQRAPAADVGTKRPCDACGLEVWVPVAAGVRPQGVQSCLGCGRPVKATATSCMYCGRPPSSET